MKKIRKKYRCGCCGCKFERELIVSSYYPDAALDGRPIGVSGLVKASELIDELIECPFCHFAGYNIERIVDDNLRRCVEEATATSDVLTRALLFTEDRSERIRILQMSVWEAEDRVESEEKLHSIRGKLISELEQALNERPSFELAALYLEANRLDRRFDQAKRVIQELEDSYDQMTAPNTKEMEEFLAFLKYEKKLVDSNDSMPHKRSEVII